MNKMLVASFIIMAIVFSFLILQLYYLQTIITHYQQPRYTIYLTNVNIDIVYQGVTSGYLGPSTQSYTFDAYLVHGQIFYYTITFTSSAVLLNHQITSIVVTTPGFMLLNTSPQLPVTISPGGQVSITLEILVTNTNYLGPLTLTVYTS